MAVRTPLTMTASLMVVSFRASVAVKLLRPGLEGEKAGAAADLDRLAGDVAGFFRGEEGDEVADLLGPAGPPHGDDSADTFLEFRGHRVEGAAVDRSEE